ncbi:MULTISPECIES: winged helix-turn-helix domain-containing protein [unclassified Variovorax]|uniref:winged helix-turn-helix domain-containing protein n=1 Tax=unclassified Variovorax TaxID=663243 RepID=UPI003F484B42
MIKEWTSRNVALVDGAEAQRVQLRQRLERGGYAPVVFSDAAGLLASFGLGNRFDLVLVVEDDALTWCQLSAVCRVLRVPAFLLIQESDWKKRMARDQDFLASPLFDFALLNTDDSELYTRMSTLLLRAGDREDTVERLEPAKQTTVGGYRFVEGLQLVVYQGKEVRLASRQFEVAFELFRNLGGMVERKRLWTSLWGEYSPRKGTRALDVCVANVRKKLDLYPENGFVLRAVYKRGYQLQVIQSRAFAALEAE